MKDELFPNGIHPSTPIPARLESSRGMQWGFLAQNVFCVAAFTAIMAGAGAFLGSDFEDGDVVAEQNLLTDINIAVTNVSDIQDMLLEVEVEAQDLNNTFGQACVAALRQYIEDPQLATTSQDSIVQDVVSDPSAPCGDVPTQVRKKFLGISDVLQRHAGLKNYPMGERMQEIDQMKATLENKNNTNDSHVGAWIFGIFGLAVGCFGSKIAYEESDGGRH